MGSIISTPTTTSSALSSTSFATSNLATIGTPPDCPSVALVPASLTSTSTVTSYTRTTTVSAIGYTSTATVTGSYTYTVYSSIPIYTQTSTYTSTAQVVISQVPFTSTVTVPTSPGFTPVLCEATYQDPGRTTTTIVPVVTVPGLLETTLTSTSNAVTTRTVPKFVATVTFTFFYTAASIVTIIPTRTSTRINPVQTVYDACSSNNVIDFLPDRSGYLVNAFTTDPNVRSDVYAIDPTDCCALCQGNSSCIASAYFVGQIPACSLYLHTSDQCDPTYTGAYLAISTATVPEVYVSNSGCGQIGPYPENY